jgi:hypothetical protein
MANYDPPNMRNIPFKFTSPGGYSAPSFGDVPFRFGLRPSYSSTSDLQSAINIMGIYQDSTYTYLKECPTQVIGYGTHGIQILKLPCIYGGIRDLGGYVYGNPPNVDLHATIIAVSNWSDLSAYVKSTIQAYKNLGARIKIFEVGYKNLTGYITGPISDYKDLSAILAGKWWFGQLDLLATIYAIPPKDLQAILNVIEIRDLPASIKGEWWHGQIDLQAEVYKIWQHGIKNLSASLYGTQELDLISIIHAFQYRNLPAYMEAFDYKNLPVLINLIEPVNLPSFIHGWDIRYLSASLNGVYGPYDIQASIYGIPSENLSAYIDGYKGVKVPFDLKGMVESYYCEDLQANIFPISYVDLRAILNSSGKSDYLLGIIIPKVVHVKRAINVSLLNHKNLGAVINFACFASGYKDLSAYVYIIQKLDLRGFIFGRTPTGDNIVDLNARINTGIAEAHNGFNIRYLPSNDSINLNVKISLARMVYTYDTLLIRYGQHDNLDLRASIIGILTTKDLSAYLNPIVNPDFSQLPRGRRTKMHEIVINLARGEEQWQREAEILFNTSVPEYFYISGNQNIYREDRDDHWVIRVEGYEKLEESGIERGKNRTKYIFKLSNYSSIDAAIRDMIDRVTAFRRSNLAATITSIGYYNDLAAKIIVKRTFKSRRNVLAFINGFIATEVEKDLSAYINGL